MDQVDEVKSKVDIVEVISAYIPLKKAGRNLSGLCPFHGEKTPSFMVSPERQVFKCFGCGEGGDVISFLEKIEGWEFREALEELAKRAGVKLKSFAGKGESKQKEKILEINKVAAKFFSYVLLKHKSGEVAREYLRGRGIHQDIWVKFGLGYAPDSWDKTLSVLKKKGFSNSDVAASGLVVSRQGSDGGYYDRFRGRLMFPIFDTRGNVVGFSGRVIVGDEKSAKYVNSPETPVFSKGSVLFGYFQTKDFIREKNEVILVEGEFDMLSLFQAGFKNVVASKGTALTENQVKLLGRSAETVVLCFDSDFAGDKAARRGIEMLDGAGMLVRVIRLGSFGDPDEFVHKDTDGFKKALKNASNFYDFLIESATSRFDPSTVYGKKKIGQELFGVIERISDDVVRAHYIGRLSQVLGVESSLITRNITNKTTTFENTEKDDLSVASGAGRSERYFLAMFLMGETLNLDFFKILAPADFADGVCSAFWKGARDIIVDSKLKSKRKFLEKLPDRFKTFVDSLYLLEVGAEFLDDRERAGEMVDVARRIKNLSIKKKLKDITEMMKIAEGRGDWDEVVKLSKKFNDLSQNLKEGVVNA